MNFKTILGLSVFALLSTVNAAPVSGTKTISSSVSSTKTVSSSTKTLPSPRYEEFNILKENCSIPSGFPLVEEYETGVTYSCLRAYFNGNQEKATPENSACLYAGEKIMCVDNEVSNIKECSKNDESYDYNACMRKISYLVDVARSRKSVLSGPLRTYPKKEKIEESARKDQKECVDNNGILLLHQNILQYICLSPEEAQYGLFDKHCVSVDGTTYCVNEEDSNIDICKKSTEFYNFEKCLNLLLLLGKTNNVNIV